MSDNITLIFGCMSALCLCLAVLPSRHPQPLGVAMLIVSSGIYALIAVSFAF